MKNMFKLMGVALLAGAMLFTACKKDKEDSGTTPVSTATVTVNFNGSEWSNSDVIDHETYNGGLHNFFIYRNNDEYVELGAEKLEAGVEQSYTISSNYVKYWTITTEYNNMLTDGSLTFSAVDLVTKTLSANINVQFRVQTSAGDEMWPFNMVLNNAQWREVLTK